MTSYSTGEEWSLPQDMQATHVHKQTNNQTSPFEVYKYLLEFSSEPLPLLGPGCYEPGISSGAADLVTEGCVG